MPKQIVHVGQVRIIDVPILTSALGTGWGGRCYLILESDLVSTLIFQSTSGNAAFDNTMRPLPTWL